MHRLMIAGTHSGCGKTTVTCALLGALRARGRMPVACKCGPDYIDPMFHRAASDVAARNLDPFFCDSATLRGLVAEAPGDIAVLEGAMGYYDGVGPDGRYSALDVARATRTPVVLVVDARGMYASAGALLRGFASYRPENQIRGVIFNNASAALYDGLKALAGQAGLLPLGYLPREARAAVASRHLGLVTADEISGLRGKMRRLAALAAASLDLDGLLALAAAAPALPERLPAARPRGAARLAVARDAAFCFRYEENMALLRALGCELAYFSPLVDEALPEGCAGLYLCGGYPELHCAALSANAPLRAAVRAAVRAGMPTLAECGGFLYLHETLDNLPLAGAIRAQARRTEKLQPFGYVTLTAAADNLLCRRGERLRGHAFHYCQSSDQGAGFRAEKPLSGRAWPCAHASPTLYAGFPHLYFLAHPRVAENFVDQVIHYAAHRNHGANRPGR